MLFIEFWKYHNFSASGYITLWTYLQDHPSLALVALTFISRSYSLSGPRYPTSVSKLSPTDISHVQDEWLKHGAMEADKNGKCKASEPFVLILHRIALNWIERWTFIARHFRRSQCRNNSKWTDESTTGAARQNALDMSLAKYNSVLNTDCTLLRTEL